MSNATITATSITIHGRGSLTLPYVLKDSTGTAIDLSTRILRFEVDGVPISELLVADPNNATGKLLKLERAQVATLKKTDCPFVLVDETDLAGSDLPIVLWEGTIKKTGFTNAPDTTVDA